MKMDKLVGERFKERPSECAIDSHALMLRGGYMKYVASGIYSMTMPLRRITRKIEQIIREEMDAVDGQEVLFPVVLPGTLWEESGRFTSVGGELLRLKDRNDNQMVLGMTHEEAAVHLAREHGNSYAKYPFMIYQFQTKFRDEARPRGGMIRVREFTMKDAYSFHTSQEDLEVYYDKCFRAYERIFERAGLPGVVSVASDSGMMGGSISHEFMMLTPVGEDTLAICSACDYRANMEAAESIVHNENGEQQALTRVHTPNQKTIDEVCSFLQQPVEHSCKAVVYQRNKDDSYIVIFLCGDLELNETKLTNAIGEEVHPAIITEESGIVAGFIGPQGLPAGVTMLFDNSVKDAVNLVCGANEADYHYTGFSIERECGEVTYGDFAKIKDGGICPCCGKPSITISRGIEVGNIFQLGTKYTKAMNMEYADETGVMHNPIMGCYGIGVGRLAASICEASHDEYGPLWPMPIAPWQVHICCVRADNEEVKAQADALYAELQKLGVEVVYDDRVVSAGVMFSDADLLGVPLRVIVSPRNMKEGGCEVVSRDKSISKMVPSADVAGKVKALVCEMLAKFE